MIFSLNTDELKCLPQPHLFRLALIFGKDMLENVLSGRQVGGAVPDDMPTVDDPLLGNFKLTGLSALSLTTDTLVPLSVLAVLYHVYLRE